MCAKPSHNFDSFVKEKVDEINFEFDPNHWDSLERELNNVQEQLNTKKHNLNYKWLFYSVLTTLVLLICANIIYFITYEEQNNAAIEMVSEPTIEQETTTKSNLSPVENKQSLPEKSEPNVEVTLKKEALTKSDNESNNTEDTSYESLVPQKTKIESVDSTEHSTKKKKFIIW